ncbi:hypothetical protein Pla110_15410 [Polystyrenella longa]|uniref:Secreted protein n=1 Tax=Polystyrenella longa TaxID=2528007 RepID=A0A518CKS1_9PLAN|nr:hypothetical protein [Polystyrenella longa]QDU79822.1 hypothetical protein Pla110_15410 [Polystyrenella longa]
MKLHKLLMALSIAPAALLLAGCTETNTEMEHRANRPIMEDGMHDEVHDEDAHIDVLDVDETDEALEDSSSPNIEQELNNEADDNISDSTSPEELTEPETEVEIEVEETDPVLAPNPENTQNDEATTP